MLNDVRPCIDDPSSAMGRDKKANAQPKVYPNRRPIGKTDCWDVWV
jgi:hypothetical protein